MDTAMDESKHPDPDDEDDRSDASDIMSLSRSAHRVVGANNVGTAEEQEERNRERAEMLQDLVASGAQDAHKRYTTGDAASKRHSRTPAEDDAAGRSEEAKQVLPPLSFARGMHENSLKGEDTWTESDLELDGNTFKFFAVSSANKTSTATPALIGPVPRAVVQMFDGHGGKQGSVLCARKMRQYMCEAVKLTVGGGHILEDLADACKVRGRAPQTSALSPRAAARCSAPAPFA
jgi:hypothetical protein